jgi:hypothetical protein
MKKGLIACFIPLLVIITLSLFEYGIYLTSRSYLRAEMKASIKAGISKNDLFEFTIHEFQWMKNNEILEWDRAGREVKINGLLYDIVRVEQSGTDIKMYLLSDYNEQSLMGLLDATVNKKSTEFPLMKHWKDLLKLKFQKSEPLHIRECFIDIINEFYASFNKTASGFLTDFFHPPLV